MKKIIIRTPNFIGDTINTTPCLELIKQEYPEAEFTIVGPDFVRELFKYDPRITHYITFPLKRKKKLSTYWKIVRELRKENGELGVIFVNTFISALLFRLGNVKKNIGYNREGRGFLLDFSPEINYHNITSTGMLFYSMSISGINTYIYPNYRSGTPVRRLSNSIIRIRPSLYIWEARTKNSGNIRMNMRFSSSGC